MAVLNRGGIYATLDKSKLRPRELAFALDTGKLFYCYAGGAVKELATKEDLQLLLDSSAEAYVGLQQLIAELQSETVLTGILSDIVSNADTIAVVNSNLESGLAEKVGKNESSIITYPMLASDIKSIITGGTSISTVSTGAVDNKAILNGRITPDKNTKDLTINVVDLPLYQANAYINNAGTIVNLSGFNIYKLSLNKYMKYFTLTFGTNSAYYGLWYNDNNTIKSVLATSFNNVVYQNKNGYLLINSDGTGAGIVSANLHYNTKNGYLDNDKYFLGLDNANNELQGIGYINNNTVYAISSYAMYKFNYNSDLSYFLEGTIGVIFGCCYKADNTYLGNITLTNGKLNFLPNTDYFIVNINYDTYIYATKNTTVVEPTNYCFQTVVNKPYIFSGKTAGFFGNSITRGYTAGSTITETDNYPKLFSERVGMTYVNYGIGGSCLARNANAVQSMLDKVAASNIAKDFLFFAIGTNDYYEVVPMGSYNSTDSDTFYGALNELCTYLKINAPSANIIFILPINRATYVNNDNILDDYRQAIFNKAMENEFSVVDGSQFGFPSENNDYASVVFGDLLHPSVKGYRMYTKGLCTALC